MRSDPWFRSKFELLLVNSFSVEHDEQDASVTGTAISAQLVTENSYVGQRGVDLLLDMAIEVK